MSIEIVAYDPSWPRAFEAERTRLAAGLGAIALRIEHNGSTAVPGMAAKPVIDIQISVRHLQPLAHYATALQQLGYTHVAHPDDDFCPFFHRPHAWPHTHHVHVVEAGGLEERRTLAFRDYLRAHAEVAAEYQALKRQLATQFRAAQLASHEAYAAAKSSFIEAVIERAFAECAAERKITTEGTENTEY